MKKLLVLILLTGSIFPLISIPSVEAGVSPEGIPRRPRDHYPEGRPRPRKPRCKTHGKVVVCRMPRQPRKCTIRRPCVPPGYYRPTPPPFGRVVPM